MPNEVQAGTWAIIESGVVTNRIVADATYLAATGQQGFELSDGQQCDIGWSFANGTFTPPVDEPSAYQWVELENALRGTDLFAVAFAFVAPLVLITHAFANTDQTNENRWADFQFAVMQIEAAYSTAQRVHFQALLKANGFPSMPFSAVAS